MRYTVNIPDKLDAVFKEVAAEQEISQSELMRRALTSYSVLWRETSQGKKVAILKGGVVEKEIVLSL